MTERSSVWALAADRGDPRPRRTHWLPLPRMLSGVVIHHYDPSIIITAPPPSETSAAASDAAAGSTQLALASVTDHDNLNVIPVDVGDEIFAFEEYRRSQAEADHEPVWYRGYVVQNCTASPAPKLRFRAHPLNTIPSTEPSVLIGIFPSTCVHIRNEAELDDDTLPRAYLAAVSQADPDVRIGPAVSTRADMEAVVEEEDQPSDIWAQTNRPLLREEDTTVVIDIPSISAERPSSKCRQPDASRQNRPSSMRLAHDSRREKGKQDAPLPRMKAGDSTIAGDALPLIDEIACAIREWHGRLPLYLSLRDYRLFDTVVQHIDALLVGRTQIMLQTLGGEELVNVKQECVSRLVKCNVAQGLDVILRHPEDGSVMTLDRDRATSDENMTNGIDCYIHQVQLAYIDYIPLDTLSRTSSSRFLLPIPTTAHLNQGMSTPKTNASSMLDGGMLDGGNNRSHHILLDVRAFAVSLCDPGEVVELFFSLYSRKEGRFLTEEFALYLNHLGSPLHHAEQRLRRLRVLYTELRDTQLQSQVYIVCRLIRNGGFNTRRESKTAAPGSFNRNGEMQSKTGAKAFPRSPSTQSIASLDRQTVPSSSMMSSSMMSSSMMSDIDEHRSSPTWSGDFRSTIPNGRHAFRRPLGVAVSELPPVPTISAFEGDMNDALDVMMPLYLPQDESTFATLHEDVLENRSKTFVVSDRSEGIAISLRSFRGVLSQVVRQHPTLLLDTPQAAQLGFAPAIEQLPRNDLYIKLWSATADGNSASHSDTIRSRRRVMQVQSLNLQVTIEVCDGEGNAIPEAIFAGGVGESPVTRFSSLVFQHCDRPIFGELVKICLPATAEDYHLSISLLSRRITKTSKSLDADMDRLLGQARLPLIRNGAVVKDGSHDLVVIRNDNVATTRQSALDSSTNDGPKLGDRVTVKTLLCSANLTHDETLRALFRSQTSLPSPEDIKAILELFVFVNEDELVRLASPILDSLFGIMIAQSVGFQDEVDHLILTSLIRLLSLASDRRFPAFGDTVDAYVSDQFRYPSSSHHLLRSIKNVMGKPDAVEYRSLLKVWHWVFRFIIRARELDRSRGTGLDVTSAHLEADFGRMIKEILAEISAMMASPDQRLLGTQTLAAQNFANILPYLMKIFPSPEVTEIVIAFADTLTLVKGTIVLYKLQLILRIVENAFETPAARALLVPAIIRWVKPHLGCIETEIDVGESDADVTRRSRTKWLECNRLSLTVIAVTIKALQGCLSSAVIKGNAALLLQEEDNLEYCLSLIPKLLETHRVWSTSSIENELRQTSSTSSTIFKTLADVFPTSHPFNLMAELPASSLIPQHGVSDDSWHPVGFVVWGAVESAVIIFSLALAVPRANQVRWLEEMLEIEGRETMSNTLQAIFGFCLSIVKSTLFPQRWLSLNLMFLGTTIQLLELISDVLERSFVPALEEMQTFDAQLWSSCLRLICELASSPELALEELGRQRRRSQWLITGDLRNTAAAVLSRVWSALGWEGQDGGPRLGGYQTRFTGLAGQIIELCLSTHDGLCETAVEILFSMIYAEYVLEGQFRSIQAGMLVKLDRLFQESVLASQFSEPTARAYFVARLRSVSHSSMANDHVFKEHVNSFLDEVELFIDHLLALREIPVSSTWKDERALALHGLVSFTERVGRDDLYIGFTQQLFDLYLEARDHLAAGHALLLHARMYAWKGGHGGFLEEYQAGILDLPVQVEFNRKESLYFHAIDQFAQAEAYESALALCQELTAQHQAITFMVPRISELLEHQAKLWSRIASTPRIHPEYYRVAYFGEASIMHQGKDYIVRGQPWQRYSDFCDAMQDKHPAATIHQSKIAPSEIIRHGTSPVIWITAVTPEPDASLPVMGQGIADGFQAYWRHNNIRDFSSHRPYDRQDQGGNIITWTEKTLLTTADTLPGVLNLSEIIEIRYEQIKPILNALTEVRKATRTLEAMTCGPIDVKQLGNVINGAVDSPVNGGVGLYRATFLSSEYLQEHPDEIDNIEAIRNALGHYADVISAALKVHKGYCRDLAFQEAMENLYIRNFGYEIAGLQAGVPNASEQQAHSSHENRQAGDVGVWKRRHEAVARTPLIALSEIQPPLRLPANAPTLADSPTLEISSHSSPAPARLLPCATPTVTSSPRLSTLSGSGRAGAVSRLSSRTSQSAETTTPSLGDRARSIIGSIPKSGSGRSRDSIRVISGGTVSEMGSSFDTRERDESSTIPRAEMRQAKSKHGLKRWSSLMSRK